MISQQRKSADTYIRRLVTRVTNLGRMARLRHQFTDIEQRALELPRSYREQLAELIGRECDAVAACPDRASYGAQTNERGATQSGLDVAMDRARSDNVHVRIRGIALWIALVYAETHDADAAEAQELHRTILRVLRELKVFSSRIESNGSGT